MVRKISLLALTALTVLGGPALSETFPLPEETVLDIVPTDAIRVEVEDADVSDCARRVIWAFNLPDDSLMYHPVCEVVLEPAPITSASNG